MVAPAWSGVTLAGTEVNNGELILVNAQSTLGTNPCVVDCYVVVYPQTGY